MKTLDPRRSKTLDPRRSGHQARAKGPLARANVSSRPQISAVQADQVRVFRETRKARERERLERFRSCRLNSSSTAASNVSKSVSITRSTSSAIPAIRCTSKISSASNAFKAPSKQTLNVCLPSLQTEEASKLSPKEGTNAKQASSQNHILPNERRSMLELLKVAKSHNLSRYRPKTFPKAEVKLNKTTRLRMLKSDPLLEFSQRFGSSSNQEACIKAMGSSVAVESENKACSTIKELQTSVRQQQFHPQKSPSPKISKVKAVPELSSSSLKRTAFSSPLRKSSAVTPKPSPLREKLAEWLEERNQSMDNFKHLQCFGVLGPVVRRPRTPYCKPHLSASMLKVIPESTESSPNRDIAQDSFECNLNTTFTLDEEDKENIDFTAEDRVLASRTQIDADSSLKDMDQAAGILSELFKLIKIGYPANQCDLWLRAVRRRFPQCGDVPIYWECLASLDEARGDLQSALSCYENAILQGAEGSVQMSLSELLKKMASLQIVPTWSSTNGRGGTKKDEKLNLSNIIRSSAIQFEVQENCNSSSEEKPVFTATPVRRSTRLALTPVPSLPGITCVRSLDFLEPNIRSSLVFHGNSALDPKD